MPTSFLLTGFFVDDLMLPWGTTLAEAAARLAGPSGHPTAASPTCA